ncbi:hypothetical protein MMC09_005025 [Bachmanniomyces sp. S44760]|nr:hypothetical protein [Bachmanniomyces sp. S44760]
MDKFSSVEEKLHFLQITLNEEAAKVFKDFRLVDKVIKTNDRTENNIKADPKSQKEASKDKDGSLEILNQAPEQKISEAHADQRSSGGEGLTVFFVEEDGIRYKEYKTWLYPGLQKEDDYGGFSTDDKRPDANPRHVRPDANGGLDTGVDMFNKIGNFVKDQKMEGKSVLNYTTLFWEETKEWDAVILDRIEALQKHLGMILVVSAGNGGIAKVGSVSKAGEISYFSQGPKDVTTTAMGENVACAAYIGDWAWGNSFTTPQMTAEVVSCLKPGGGCRAQVEKEFKKMKKSLEEYSMGWLGANGEEFCKMQIVSTSMGRTASLYTGVALEKEGKRGIINISQARGVGTRGL